MSRSVVIGAGLAGLTAAFRLHAAGRSVLVLEAEDRPGGTVRSVEIDGHRFEHGPTTVPSTAPNLARLIDDVGLRPAALLSRPIAGRRLVWRHGRLHALPEKPPQLLTCSALGPLAKLRLLAEPLIPARRDGADETLLDFGRRRLGQGAVDAFLDPFVTGIFAGRLDRLGVDALPRLAELEAEHGSLFRGLIAARKAKARAADPEVDRPQGPPPLVSFAEGLEVLPRTLASRLASDGESSVESGCRVDAIEPRGDSLPDDCPDGFRLRVTTAAGERAIDAAEVVVATPSAAACRLLEPVIGELPAALESIPHPFVATVGLGYPRDAVEHPLDAFGLLVASDSRLPDADALGILFASSIFDGRAPDGHVTLTVMLGGERDPSVAELDDSELIARARAATAQCLGARGEPTATTVGRWPRAIPQYLPGHRRAVAALRRQLADHRGLAVAGNYLDGVGVEGTVTSAEAAVASILDSTSSGDRSR